MTTIYQTVEKENIQSLKFPNSDVLQDNDAIFQRQSELNRAQSLGNLEHSKIKIFFEDNESRKVVETTVWAVTDNRVVLNKALEFRSTAFSNRSKK